MPKTFELQKNVLVGQRSFNSHCEFAEGLCSKGKQPSKHKASEKQRRRATASEKKKKIISQNRLELEKRGIAWNGMEWPGVP